jgi:hypothetical protein
MYALLRVLADGITSSRSSLNTADCDPATNVTDDDEITTVKATRGAPAQVPRPQAWPGQADGSSPERDDSDASLAAIPRRWRHPTSAGSPH